MKIEQFASRLLRGAQQLKRRERDRRFRWPLAYCGEALTGAFRQELCMPGRSGSIILTALSAAAAGAPACSATKAEVRNLARTWAHDLKRTGIRVNVLSPRADGNRTREGSVKAFSLTNPLEGMVDPAETGSEVAVDAGLAQI